MTSTITYTLIFLKFQQRFQIMLYLALQDRQYPALDIPPFIVLYLYLSVDIFPRQLSHPYFLEVFLTHCMCVCVCVCITLFLRSDVFQTCKHTVEYKYTFL